MKRNVGCRNCGTVLGESITEWRLGVNTVVIQPYLSAQIKDNLVDCPTCSNKVDITIPESILPSTSYRQGTPFS